MDIVLVNDSQSRIRSWSKALAGHNLITFDHPNSLLFELNSSPKKFGNASIYIFDRYFYGEDLIHDPIFDEISKMIPKLNAKKIVSSGHHIDSDKLEGFDLVLSGRSRPLESILSKVKLVD